MLHYPRMTTVRKAEKLKISQRQVQKSLKRLQEAGDIISLNKRGSYGITESSYPYWRVHFSPVNIYLNKLSYFCYDIIKDFIT